jgi:hypothetical protein
MTTLTPETPGTPETKLVLTVAHHAVAEIQELCARLGLAVETIAAAGWRRAILIVEGGASPIRGFADDLRTDTWRAQGAPSPTATA